MKDKIAGLSKIYSDVKKATEDRNSALETTLGVSEDFWTGIDEVRHQLQDVGGSLGTQDKPSLDPDSLRDQQEKMQVGCLCLRRIGGSVDLFTHLAIKIWKHKQILKCLLLCQRRFNFQNRRQIDDVKKVTSKR